VTDSSEPSTLTAKLGERDAPAISVIVAMEDDREYATAVLEGFLDQTVEPERFELLVVSWQGGRSFAAAIDRLRTQPRAPEITYLRCPTRSRAAKNNLGIAHASAPILCFCGDDFVPCASYIEAHLDYHETHPESTRVAIGPGLSPESMRCEAPFIAWLEDSGELFGARFRDSELSLPTTFFYVANSSIKRSLFERAGSFDERLPFPACDDSEYGHRLASLGMVAELVPRASCIHDHRFTLEDRLISTGWAGASHAILTTGEPNALRRARQGAALHLAPLREWCHSIPREGPRVARWRWKLASAYLSGYRRQIRKARANRSVTELGSGAGPG